MQIVFLIGFPRSGTTWFAKLLDAHPDTIYRHEPFGRDYGSFGLELFHKLKFRQGLSDQDFKAMLKVLIRANPNTEKLPFFYKRYQTHNGLKRLLWLAAKATPLCAPLYRALFTPHDAMALIVKETRSDMNLQSIIAGARADNLIILIRHPYDVIASHIRGLREGRMAPAGELRKEWAMTHADAPYVKAMCLTDAQIFCMSEVEYIALTWRVQNEEYLRIHANHNKSIIIGYENFLTERKAEPIFSFLGLPWDQQVSRFLEDSRGGSRGYFSVFAGFVPNKWRAVLADSDIKCIDRHTADLVRHTGLWKTTDQASSARSRSANHPRCQY